MKHSRTGRLLAAALVAVLAACSDSATTTTSPLIKASGGPSLLINSPALDSVAPTTATVASGVTQQFTAWALTATLPMDPSSVTWTVSGVGNTIDATGLFTAVTTAGTFTVSVVDKLWGNTVTVSVTVTVASTCKPHDDRKECEGGKDHGGKGHGGRGHGGNRHIDRGHGGKNADEGRGGKNGNGHGG